MKTLFLFIGLLCMVLGAVGVVVPVLPTAPFLLVASFCFTKGSQRFNDWFISTGLYRNHLESLIRTRAMTIREKVNILGLATFLLLMTFILVNVIYARILIIMVLIIKYYYFVLKIKTEKGRLQND